MKSILNFFDETKNEKIIKESSRKRNKYIKNINVLPNFYCPEDGSLMHQRDVDMIKWYYDNKSLSKNFLTTSNDSVKKVFKMSLYFEKGGLREGFFKNVR